MGHQKFASHRILTPGLILKAAQAAVENPANCAREAAFRGGRRRGPRRPARQHRQQQAPTASVNDYASTSESRAPGVVDAFRVLAVIAPSAVEVSWATLP